MADLGRLQAMKTGSPSWTLVRLVVAARGFWSPKVMSVKNFKVLVAFS